jgi:hypothetical protein
MITLEWVDKIREAYNTCMPPSKALYELYEYGAGEEERINKDIEALSIPMQEKLGGLDVYNLPKEGDFIEVIQDVYITLDGHTYKVFKEGELQILQANLGGTWWGTGDSDYALQEKDFRVIE